MNQRKLSKAIRAAHYLSETLAELLATMVQEGSKGEEAQSAPRARKQAANGRGHKHRGSHGPKSPRAQSIGERTRTYAVNPGVTELVAKRFPETLEANVLYRMRCPIEDVESFRSTLAALGHKRYGSGQFHTTTYNAKDVQDGWVRYWWDGAPELKVVGAE